MHALDCWATTAVQGNGLNSILALKWGFTNSGVIERSHILPFFFHISNHDVAL